MTYGQGPEASSVLPALNQIYFLQQPIGIPFTERKRIQRLPIKSIEFDVLRSLNRISYKFEIWVRLHSCTPEATELIPGALANFNYIVDYFFQSTCRFLFQMLGRKTQLHRHR